MWDYIRDLTMIEKDFYAIDDLEEPERTQRLVNLMDELEENYKAFIANPTPEDLERREIRLYRKIAMARNL